MNLKITKVTVITSRHEMDRIVAKTDLPCGVLLHAGALDLVGWIARGRGLDYVKKHFPDVEVEFIDMEE